MPKQILFGGLSTVSLCPAFIQPSVPQRVELRLKPASARPTRSSCTAVPTPPLPPAFLIRHGLELTQRLRNLLALLLDAVTRLGLFPTSVARADDRGADCNSAPDRRRPLRSRQFITHRRHQFAQLFACLPRSLQRLRPRLRGLGLQRGPPGVPGPVSSQSTRMV